ncbi:hypothetical protein OE749_06515 [Aestuariibacter sp. AA17]|uniref:Uncharacterized protein n=1 Tax=Fluctibacter corallii TaxID=2984329 RepID=A0ABT3A6L9_9ALTE|nr:hypothetical protein [Aestuariibacter sp. AA17]MCV2884343.1 hypothetical protein [Aestuariibacter sp. AA17]
MFLRTHTLFVLLSAYSVGSTASDINWVDNSVKWLKSSLPDSTQLEFQKNRFKGIGCLHEEYELTFTQPLHSDWDIEFSVSQAKGELNWGMYSQKVRTERFGVMPTYSLTDSVKLGIGYIYQSAPDFRSMQGEDTQLAASRHWVIKTEMPGFQNDHTMNVSVVSSSWNAQNSAGNWMERGAVDTKLMLTYEVKF